MLNVENTIYLFTLYTIYFHSIYLSFTLALSLSKWDPPILIHKHCAKTAKLRKSGLKNKLPFLTRMKNDSLLLSESS